MGGAEFDVFQLTDSKSANPVDTLSSTETLESPPIEPVVCSNDTFRFGAKLIESISGSWKVSELYKLPSEIVADLRQLFLLPLAWENIQKLYRVFRLRENFRKNKFPLRRNFVKICPIISAKKWRSFFCSSLFRAVKRHHFPKIYWKSAYFSQKNLLKLFIHLWL